MKNSDFHLSDQKLLLDVEGELPTSDQKLVQSHLNACWKCRVRRQELADAIVDFVRFHQRESDAKIPPVAGPRALLKARMAQLSTSEPSWPRFFRGFVWVAAVCGLLAFGLFLVRMSAGHQNPSPARTWIVSIPDSRLTPGATLLASRSAVCAQSNTNNKSVPASVRRKVFEEYGMAGVDPRAYEVDYLVTPALGGADDIHNLWPHSYSSTAWNAQVKDALEDRLRGMVCDGSLDLTEAQREIASNWIAAYKKYFHTDQPIENHWR
jgi:hypothetical protein